MLSTIERSNSLIKVINPSSNAFVTHIIATSNALIAGTKEAIAFEPRSCASAGPAPVAKVAVYTVL